MRNLLWFSIFVIVPSIGRPQAINYGDPFNLIAPATNADGRVVVFASAIAPDGTPQPGNNIYVFTQTQVPALRRLTNYAGDSTFTGVTSVAYHGAAIVYTATPAGFAEELHLLSQTPFGVADRTLASDKADCLRDLGRYCVGPTHLNADESKVLYAVARQQPFYVANTDGSGVTRLPIYSGVLAPSPQRVISRAAMVAFT